MGYYVRALLTEWEPRPLRELIDFSREYGHELRPERPEETPLDDPEWRVADLLGPQSSAPIEVEVNLDDGKPDGMVREELREFRDEIEDAEAEADALRTVREHLDRTAAIVAVRVPASDADDGMDAAHAVLAYYGQRDGVLFQADAEGFYDREELIVETG